MRVVPEKNWVQTAAITRRRRWAGRRLSREPLQNALQKGGVAERRMEPCVSRSHVLEIWVRVLRSAPVSPFQMRSWMFERCSCGLHRVLWLAENM